MECSKEARLYEALRFSEARRALCEGRLDLVQQVASLGFWDWHIHTNELYWSDEIYTIFGLEKAEFQPSYPAFLQFVHPDDRVQVERAVAAALKNKAIYNIDHRIVLPRGEIRDVNEQARVLYGPDGKPNRMLGTVLDVTARKEAERTLIAGQSRFRHLWESAYNAMLIVGEDGRISMVNRSAERMFGASREELVGARVETLIPERCRRDHVASRQKYHASADVRKMGERDTLVALRADGSEFEVEISLSPLEDGGGADVLVEVQDVSGRKALESQLCQSQRLEALGRLAGGVAHDLNNVLTAVMAFTEMGLVGIGENHRSSDDLREVLKASEHAKSLIGQLLAFTRQQVLQPCVVSVNETIESTAGLLNRLLCENIALDVHLDPELKNLYMDPNQLEQILVNLAVNASDAMPDGGSLTVSTRNVFLSPADRRSESGLPPGAYVCLAVQDTGTGMSDVVKNHLFEPFYTTKGPGKGTGLGLSTVYGIVKQSRGHIEVESELGVGTTFSIYLPATEDTLTGGPAPKNQGRRRTDRGVGDVLLIEDDKTIRFLAHRILTSSGYTAHVAENGKRALELLASLEKIDLIISDVVLPDTRGPKLLGPVMSERPELPVLYMSGYDGGGFAGDGLRRFARRASAQTLHTLFPPGQGVLYDPVG